MAVSFSGFCSSINKDQLHGQLQSYNFLFEGISESKFEYNRLEVIAKPQKTGAKPMGQNVHAGCKTSNVAALAASTIVNCPLSIVNFLGFATGSDSPKLTKTKFI
jgi:hypothetical protein